MVDLARLLSSGVASMNTKVGALQNGMSGAQPRITTRLINVDTVAEMTLTSRRTVFRWNAGGRMPRPIRIGHCLRWRQSDINLWIVLGCPDQKTYEARREAVPC